MRNQSAAFNRLAVKLFFACLRDRSSTIPVVLILLIPIRSILSLDSPQMKQCRNRETRVKPFVLVNIILTMMLTAVGQLLSSSDAHGANGHHFPQMPAVKENHAFSHPPTLSCQQVFAEVTYSSVLQKANEHINRLGMDESKNRNVYSVTFGKDIQRLLLNTRTPADYIKTLQFIEELSALPVTISYNHGSYISRSTLGEAFIYEMTEVDFVKPLLQIQNQLTTQARQDIISQLEQWKAFDTTGDISSTYIKTGWKEIFEPIYTLFQPERILTYIENISSQQEFLKEKSKSFQFGLSLRTVSNQLPAAIKMQAKQKISELVYSDYEERWEDDKNQRRNREIVHRLIYNDEFRDLLNQLKRKSSVSTEVLVNAIDEYWAKVHHYPTQHNRPNYSFQRVLDVAKAIQTSPFAPYLENEYVLLFGSFTNGKANLQTSDIDLHPSSNIVQQFLDNQLTYKYHDATINPHSEHSKLTPTDAALKMSKRLVRTEQAIAQILKRSAYKPSELLGIIPNDDPFFAIPTLGFYNPLILKVTTTKMSLFIVDAFDSGKVFEIEIQ